MIEEVYCVSQDTCDITTMSASFSIRKTLCVRTCFLAYDEMFPYLLSEKFFARVVSPNVRAFSTSDHVRLFQKGNYTPVVVTSGEAHPRAVPSLPVARFNCN